MTLIQTKVTQIIMELLGLFPSEVILESDIIEDLGADSLDLVEILMKCEVEFKINIPDEKAEKIRTVNELISVIKDRIPTQNNV